MPLQTLLKRMTENPESCGIRRWICYIIRNETEKNGVLMQLFQTCETTDKLGHALLLVYMIVNILHGQEQASSLTSKRERSESQKWWDEMQTRSIENDSENLDCCSSG